MELHLLECKAGSKSPRKRLGRGRSSGTGKTCGHGHKGQMARKGHKHKAGFEGGQMPLIRRIPKRGAHNKPRHEYLPVNVGSLDIFDDGAEVSPEVLRNSGLANGPSDGIKILGKGDITRKLTIKAHQFSASARSKIEKAGGTVEVIKK